jgi:hypothetical protein
VTSAVFDLAVAPITQNITIGANQICIVNSYLGNAPASETGGNFTIDYTGGWAGEGQIFGHSTVTGSPTAISIGNTQGSTSYTLCMAVWGP